MTGFCLLLVVLLGAQTGPVDGPSLAKAMRELRREGLPADALARWRTAPRELRTDPRVAGERLLVLFLYWSAIILPQVGLGRTLPRARTRAGRIVSRALFLVGLMLLFRSVPAIDDVSFALVFMVFFFLLVALEIVVVERSLQGSTLEQNGRPA